MNHIYIYISLIHVWSSAQTCQWKLFVWSIDSNKTVSIQPVIPTIDLDSYVTNGEWELRATRSWHEVVLRGSDDYSTFLYYEVTLRRRPSLLVLTVLLPVLVLALVNVFVFTIPSEAGRYSVFTSPSEAVGSVHRSL